MTSENSKGTSGSQSIKIDIGGNASGTHIMQAGGSNTHAENTGGNVVGSDNIENDAQLLSDLAEVLEAAGTDGQAAMKALNEEFDKARKEEPVDQFKLAGVIGQIAKLVPTAANMLIDLFAPAVWGKLAKGAVKTAVDSIRTTV